MGLDARDGRAAVSLPPESIEVGKCYLAQGRLVPGRSGLRVRRVVQILPDGRVRFEQRRGPVPVSGLWPRSGIQDLQAFAAAAEREVPCDWTLEQAEA